MNKKEEYMVGIEPTLKSIQAHLTLHDVDHTFLGPSISKAIDITAQLNEVNTEMVLFGMLPIFATACGLNTYIDAGSRPILTKPNMYVINVLNSGGAKSQVSSLLLKNTLKPLDKKLRDRTQQQLDGVVIDKAIGNITNATEKKDAMEKIRLSEHNALVSKGTPQSIFHYAGNGAMLLYYDELATFISMYIGKERAIQDLTELYQTHSVKKLLVGRGSASIDDSSVSLYAHGTPEYGKQLLSSDMRSDGSCWRFWPNVYTPEPTTLSYEDYANNIITEIPDFSEFNELFSRIVGQHFERTTEWIYSYTEDALAGKQEIQTKLMWLTNSVENSLMKTMLLKLLAIIDKCALIHTIIKDNTKRDDLDLIPTGHLRLVTKDSLDFGWEMARKIWTGWMTLIQLPETIQDDTEINKTPVKKRSGIEILLNDIIDLIGGEGTYTSEEWFAVVDNYPYVNRMQKTRLSKFIIESNNTVISDGKNVILRYV